MIKFKLNPVLIFIANRRRVLLIGAGFGLLVAGIDFFVRVVVLPERYERPAVTRVAAALPSLAQASEVAAQVSKWVPGKMSTEEVTTFEIRLEAIFGSGAKRRAVLAFVPSSGGPPERVVIGHNDQAKDWVVAVLERNSVTLRRGNEEQVLKMFPGKDPTASP